MSEIVTIEYSAGIGVNWINPTNAWDDINDTYANRSIPKKSADDSANYLKGTVHDNIIASGTITKVEIGVEGKRQQGDVVYLKIVPVFNGSTDGLTYQTGAYGFESDTIEWVDITNDGEAPADWSWSDIDSLDFRMYGFNPSTSIALSFYTDQLYLRITYEVAIMNQFQGSNLGADLFNGILL